MTKPNLASVLEDLYAIDPDLRLHEAQLVPLVELLLKNDPQQVPDAAFVERLRGELRQRAAVLEEELEEMRPHSGVFPFFTLNTFAAALGGAVAAVLVIAPFAYRALQNGGVPAPAGTSAPLFSYAVKDAGANAFGDLAAIPAENSRPQSGGGGPAAMPVQAPMAAMESTAEDSARNADAKMIAPGGTMPPYEITQYRYVVDGALPELSDSVEVLKREKRISSVALSSLSSFLNLGIADLSSFGDARLDNVSFVQDKPKGYAVSLNMTEGMVSVSQYWQRWPHPDAECRDDACMERYRIQLSQLPSEEETIRIAEAFAKKLGIDLTAYGAPAVDMQWKREYDKMPDKKNAWVPDVLRVLWPQLVDGKPAYEEYGGKTGVSIGVSVREKEATDVWGLQNQSYLKSAYAGVTDTATVTHYLDTFEKFPGDLPPQAKAKIVDVTLGAPEMGYMRVFQPKGDVSEELLVPALVFPVKASPTGQEYYRQQVLVPLAKDILEKRLEQPGGGIIRPMPMM